MNFVCEKRIYCDFLRRRQDVSIFSLVFIVSLFCAAAGTTNAAIVEISARPNPIYIERSDNGQYLNFDFAVKNLTDQAVEIKSVEISVFDERGKLSFRRAIDSGGFSPAIEPIPNREIPARQSVVVFNPFYWFEPFLKLKRLHYVFSLAAGGKTEEQEISVSPIEYQAKTNLILPIRRRLQITSDHDFFRASPAVRLLSSGRTANRFRVELYALRLRFFRD